jgi:hypothetical protein
LFDKEQYLKRDAALTYIARYEVTMLKEVFPSLPCTPMHEKRIFERDFLPIQQPRILELIPLPQGIAGGTRHLQVMIAKPYHPISI